MRGPGLRHELVALQRHGLRTHASPRGFVPFVPWTRARARGLASAASREAERAALALKAKAASPRYAGVRSAATPSATARAAARTTGVAVKPTERVGLYDPAQERDSCGVGLVANLKRVASHQTVIDANEMLVRMEHRGGCGCDANTGDGAGMLVGMPHQFVADVMAPEAGIDPATLVPGEYAVGNIFFPRGEEGTEAATQRADGKVRDGADCFKSSDWGSQL